MTICNVHLRIQEVKGLCAKNRIGHFKVNRGAYGILSHKYDIMDGIFLIYLQKILKNQQHLLE